MKIHTIPSILTVTLLFAAAIARGESHPAEQRKAALAAESPDQWQRAEPVLITLAGKDSQDTAALLKLSQLRLNQKRTKEAIELVERAIQVTPQDSQLHSALGGALSQRIGEVNFINQGMIAGKMLSAFRRAVELDPDNVSGWIGLARYHLHAPSIAGGSTEKAQEYAREVEKRQPHLGALELGLVFEKKGDLAAAAAEFERAAQLMPEHAWIWTSLGDFYRRAGNPQKARTAYEAALTKDPASKEAKDGLAAL